MRPAELKVRLIAEPRIRTKEIIDYLTEVGGEEWYLRVFSEILVPDAEALIEFMGRLCYKSWEPGLNRNVTKVRGDRGDYLLNVLRSGHGSVLAHAHFSFVISGCSRVFTAELNRHVAGTDISEQSLRFVRLDDIAFWEPSGLQEETLEEGRTLICLIEEFIGRAYKRELTEGMPFSEKKIITSKIRRWAPLGLATEEGWSANVRAIRHVIEMRSAAGAEEEIRLFAHQLYEIMSRACPLLFADYEDELVDGSVPAHVTPYRKV